MNSRKPFVKYDLVYSFASEDAAIIDALNPFLKRACYKTYDYRTEAHLGESLDALSNSIYREGANAALIIDSDHYRKKHTTRREFDLIQKAHREGKIHKQITIHLSNPSLSNRNNDYVFLVWNGKPKQSAQKIKDSLRKSQLLSPCALKYSYTLVLISLFILFLILLYFV